jgi:hypothetical protein
MLGDAMGAPNGPKGQFSQYPGFSTAIGPRNPFTEAPAPGDVLLASAWAIASFVGSTRELERKENLWQDTLAFAGELRSFAAVGNLRILLFGYRLP